MKWFANRIVAVIGAGSGMGRAIAGCFAPDGGHVIPAGYEASVASAAAEAEDGSTVRPVRLNAADVNQLRDFFVMVTDACSVIHAVHDQVGAPDPDGMDVMEQQREEAIGANMKSAFVSKSLSFDLMKQAGGKGAYTYLSSTSALIGSPAHPTSLMAKDGLVACCQAIALPGAPYGIRVNLVCPGVPDTTMRRRFMGVRPRAPHDTFLHKFAEMTPLGRAARQSKIASGVALLNSGDASYATGAAIPVDDGQIVR